MIPIGTYIDSPYLGTGDIDKLYAKLVYRAARRYNYRVLIAKQR